MWWQPLCTEMVFQRKCHSQTEENPGNHCCKRFSGVDVTVIATEPENIFYGDVEFCLSMVENMRLAGIHVILKNEVMEHFAVIAGCSGTAGDCAMI